jgi:hypothetical protein
VPPPRAKAKLQALQRERERGTVKLRVRVLPLVRRTTARLLRVSLFLSVLISSFTDIHQAVLLLLPLLRKERATPKVKAKLLV